MAKYVAPATAKFKEASGTTKNPPEKKKKGETKYRIAANTPVCFEYIREPILYRKKLVRIPKRTCGILKEYAVLVSKK